MTDVNGWQSKRFTLYLRVKRLANRAPVAQRIERRPPKPKVTGPNPAGRANYSVLRVRRHSASPVSGSCWSLRWLSERITPQTAWRPDGPHADHSRSLVPSPLARDQQDHTDSPNGLADKVFSADALSEKQRVIDAENSDIFDVLAYVAFAASARPGFGRVPVATL